MRHLARHHVDHPSIDDQVTAIKEILAKENIIDESLNLVIAMMVLLLDLLDLSEHLLVC